MEQVVPLESLPGFRRRFRVAPRPGRVECQVEDDFHCMAVTIDHDGVVADRVEGRVIRAPWTTCPGAEQKLRETFTGEALSDFPACREKRENCTHLYDLALLAAAHANDSESLLYDVLVSDPVEGRKRAEVRRDGACVLAWVEADFALLEPAELAGLRLDALQPWLQTLDAPLQEAARLLRWATMMANGRIIPLEEQSDATRMPPNCYTFQPDRAVQARRVGEMRDFSREAVQPLAGL